MIHLKGSNLSTFKIIYFFRKNKIKCYKVYFDISKEYFSNQQLMSNVLKPNDIIRFQDDKKGSQVIS